MISIQAKIPIECANCHHSVEAEASPVAAGEHTLEVRARCPRCRAECTVEVPPDQWLRASVAAAAPPPITPPQRAFLAMVRSVLSREDDSLEGLPPLLAAATAFEAWVSSLPEGGAKAYPSLTQVTATLQRSPAAGMLQALPEALGLDPDAEWQSEDIEAARCALIAVANNARPEAS